MEQEQKPLTLSALKERVDSLMENNRNADCYVCIPNNKGGMGGTSVTDVTYAGCGIDWDRGKFMLYPVNKMIEMPPSFTVSDYQKALQKIKTLESTLQRLIDATEGDQKHLPHTVRFSKTVLETYAKKNK